MSTIYQEEAIIDKPDLAITKMCVRGNHMLIYVCIVCDLAALKQHSAGTHATWQPSSISGLDIIQQLPVLQRAHLQCQRGSTARQAVASVLRPQTSTHTAASSTFFNTANHGRPLHLLMTHVVLVRVACGSNTLPHQICCAVGAAERTSVLAATAPEAATAGNPMPGNVESPQHRRPAAKAQRQVDTVCSLSPK